MTGIFITTVFLLAVIQLGLACFIYPVPPKITFPTQRRIEIRPGSTFKLKCVNFFRLRWEIPDNNKERISIEEDEFNKGEISIDWYTSTLTRTAASIDDSGNYTCVQLGQHSNNDTSDTVYVHISDTAAEIKGDTPQNSENKALQRMNLSYEFKEGNLEITCRALLEEGIPYHMFWQGPSRLARMNGQIQLKRLPQEVEDGRRIAVHTMMVRNVSEQNDGLYTCTLTYGDGQEHSASLSLSGHNIKLFEETSNELKQL